VSDKKAPVDNEYVWAQWAGTAFLMECRHDWERVAADESLLPGIREFARQRAQAIREELRP
jgi:hypothetical protein